MVVPLLVASISLPVQAVKPTPQLKPVEAPWYVAKTLQAPPEQEVAVSVLPTPVPTPEPVMAATAPTAGSCVDWMQQAGITDMVDASNIFMAESGCRPTATNPSSAAFGVCQSLPGSKMAVSGADWQTNPVTQMRWCDSYAQSRYGGWSNAWAFWSKMHWW